MYKSELPNPDHVIKRDRKLLDLSDVYTQNAWDDTEWTEEMYREAERKIQLQRETANLYGKDILEHETKVIDKWNEFYDTHKDKFFKDRKWIFSEFPELLAAISNPDETGGTPSCNILEVGCGVGNAVVHILEFSPRANLLVYCCDISNTAIETLKKRQFFSEHSEKVIAFQADVCKDFNSKINPLIHPNSLDFIMLVFTLSALKPESMKQTIRNLTALLKPGGMILFRDYAQYDMTQLRFKGTALLRDNYYIRSDGTTSYFFTEQIVRDIFLGNDSQLVDVELKPDRRLLINRSKGIKMSRCWLQGKFRRVA